MNLYINFIKKTKNEETNQKKKETKKNKKKKKTLNHNFFTLNIKLKRMPLKIK